LEASIFSLIIGGVCGALLLSGFRVVGRWRREDDFTARSGIKEGFLLWLAGSLTAMIVVLVIQRIEDFPLPVNIAVNDFYGGLVIGLLSYHLSLRLASWLLKDDAPLRTYGSSRATDNPETKRA
jgi:hypothetical protein